MKGNTFHHHYHILYTLRTLLRKEKAVYTEIGTFNGGSLCLMLQHPQYTECWSIDPFHLDRTNISITEENVKTFNKYQYPVYLTKQFSTNPGLLEFFKQSNFQTDILFIDGDHGRDAVRFDFHMYWRFVNPGGYIVFDDYHDALCSPEVRGAVDSIVEDIQSQGLPFKIIGYCKNFGNVYPGDLPDLNEFILRRNI